MKKLSFIFSLVALMALCSCNNTSFITPDMEQLDFSTEGGEENVSVSSDGSWEIKECPEWVTTEVQDGTLVVKVPTNDSGNVREGNIVLASGKVTATIAVKQTAKCTHITPATDAVEIDKDGGTQTVNIDTDGALQVTTPDGFTANYSGGVLTVSAGANEGGKRGGEITLEADEQTATIKVTQAGNVCPTCNGTGKVKCKGCGGRGVYEKMNGLEVYGCRKCGGRGEFDFEYGTPLAGARRGSGKATCPTCGGSGH